MVQSTHESTVGADRVVKRYRDSHRGEADCEWSGLNLLHRYAPGLAPEPLERRVTDGQPVIVMTRLPGEPLGTAALTRGQLTAVATALQRMHATVPGEELQGLAERRSGPSAQVARLRSWTGEALPPVSQAVEAALGSAAAWLDTPAVSALGDPPVEPVFAHGDGNLGNFIWDGACCRVVDFEDCGVSDPAYEVADLVEHVSVSLPGLILADEFVEMFGFSVQQQARLAGFRRLMAVFWLLMLLPGNPGHDRNPSGSLERQARRVLDLE